MTRDDVNTVDSDPDVVDSDPDALLASQLADLRRLGRQEAALVRELERLRGQIAQRIRALHTQYGHLYGLITDISRATGLSRQYVHRILAGQSAWGRTTPNRTRRRRGERQG